MKIIDILNKIAKGEKPNKIMFNNEEYLRIGNDYQRKSIVNNENYSLFNDYCLLGILDEEVEIIEDVSNTDKLEDKKIEKIKYEEDEDGRFMGMYWESKDKYLLNKINELIEEVNKLKEK